MRNGQLTATSNTVIGTGHARINDNLNADVEILREINPSWYEVRIISGNGGWNRPGKVITVRANILTWN